EPPTGAGSRPATPREENRAFPYSARGATHGKETIVSIRLRSLVHGVLIRYVGRAVGYSGRPLEIDLLFSRVLGASGALPSRNKRSRNEVHAPVVHRTLGRLLPSIASRLLRRRTGVSERRASASRRTTSGTREPGDASHRRNGTRVPTRPRGDALL